MERIECQKLRDFIYILEESLDIKRNVSYYYDDSMDSNVEGYTTVANNRIIVGVRPCGDTLKEMLTLMHEIRHVWQIENSWTISVQEGLDYIISPHEVDAFNFVYFFNREVISISLSEIKFSEKVKLCTDFIKGRNPDIEKIEIINELENMHIPYICDSFF